MPRVRKSVSTAISQLAHVRDFAFEMQFTDKTATVEAQALISAEYLRQIDKQSKEKGDDLSLEEVIKVRAQVLNTFTLQVNPAKSAFTIGSVHRKNGQLLQVLGHRANGNPYFTTVISSANIPEEE